MIVVEGPDGGGKTTLIKVLEDYFEFPIAPRVVSQDAEALVDLKAWTEANVAGGWSATIYDRHRLISEPIYGPILRNNSEPGFNDFMWLYNMNNMFRRCNPIVIYCLPPEAAVRSNVENDPDNKVIAPKIKRIYRAYVAKAATDALSIGALHYDYTSHTLSQLLKTVEGFPQIRSTS